MSIRSSRITRRRMRIPPRKVVENFEIGYPQIAEDFSGHTDGNLLEVDAQWASVVGEATNANCYGRAYFDGNMVARFYDYDAVNYIHKAYTIPVESQGVGIVCISMDINLVQAANRSFYVTFLDVGTGIAQIFVINPAGIYMIQFGPVTRQLWTETGGGGIAMTSTGAHRYNFYFDEPNNTFRVFQDGIEYFADNGAGGTFNAFYQAATAYIDTIWFSSGSPMGGGGAESSDLDAFVDNIDVDWFPQVIVSPLWNALAGDDDNDRTITRNIVEFDGRRCLLLHDVNGGGNVEVSYDINGYVSSGKLYFEIYPITSIDVNDLALVYLYEGVTQLFCIGVNPQNQNVYVWVGAVQTDTTLNVNLDAWNTIEVIFRPNTYIVKVNGVATIQYNLVNNMVLGGDQIQVMTTTNGAGHNIYLDNLGVSWL